MKDKSIWRTLHCLQQRPRDNNVTEFYGQHKLIPYSVTFLKMSRTWAQWGCCPISKCRQDILLPWRQTCNTNQLYQRPSPPPFCSDLPPPFLQPNVSLPYKDSCLALKLASLPSNTHLHFQNVLPAAGQRYNCTHFPRSWGIHHWADTSKLASVARCLLKSKASEGIPVWVRSQEETGWPIHTNDSFTFRAWKGHLRLSQL